MIKGLVLLYKAGPLSTAQLGLTRGARSDFTTLKFWGLIWKPDNDNRDLWAITRKGRRFLEGKRSIPKYVHVYNNKVQTSSEEEVFLKDVHPQEISFETVVANSQGMTQFTNHSLARETHGERGGVFSDSVGEPSYPSLLNKSKEVKVGS